MANDRDHLDPIDLNSVTAWAQRYRWLMNVDMSNWIYQFTSPPLLVTGKPNPRQGDKVTVVFRLADETDSATGYVSKRGSIKSYQSSRTGVTVSAPNTGPVTIGEASAGYGVMSPQLMTYRALRTTLECLTLLEPEPFVPAPIRGTTVGDPMPKFTGR